MWKGERGVRASLLRWDFVLFPFISLLSPFIVLLFVSESFPLSFHCFCFMCIVMFLFLPYLFLLVSRGFPLGSLCVLFTLHEISNCISYTPVSPWCLCYVTSWGTLSLYWLFPGVVGGGWDFLFVFVSFSFFSPYLFHHYLHTLTYYYTILYFRFRFFCLRFHPFYLCPLITSTAFLSHSSPELILVFNTCCCHIHFTVFFLFLSITPYFLFPRSWINFSVVRFGCFW